MITGNADLSENGLIKINENQSVEINNKSLKIRLINQEKSNWEKVTSQINGICFIEYWINPKKQILLFSDNMGEDLFRLFIPDGNLEVIVQLNREDKDDSDFYLNNFVNLDDGCLFVYEGGLVKFNLSGELQWHIKHNYYDWHFVKVFEGYALYESEFDGNWKYSLIDGKKIQN